MSSTNTQVEKMSTTNARTQTVNEKIGNAVKSSSDLQSGELIVFSKTNIENYVEQILKSSRDGIPILREKIEAHKMFINILSEVEIMPKNEKYFFELFVLVKGIQGIKGLSSVDIVNEKINVLIEHINFLGDIDSML